MKRPVFSKKSSILIKRELAIACLILTSLLSYPMLSNAQNKLTKKEKDDGWQLLFDGKTTKGWRGAFIEPFPAKGWKIDRDKYKNQLGNKFNLKCFHDAILKGGSLPLNVFETYMDEWALTQK